MKWMLIPGVLLITAGCLAGCGKSPPGQTANDNTGNQAPSALLTASPRWIPDPGDVALVKTSTLNDCQKYTVEDQVNSYLGSPHWEAGADSEGRDFVNVSGIVTYGGKPTTATFQFLIDKDKHGFQYHAFAIDGKLQPAYVAGMTLKEMCNSAAQAPVKIFQIPPGGATRGGPSAAEGQAAG